MKAGGFLARNIGKVKKLSYKGRMNLVTDVDIRCDSLITKKIVSAFPSHRIISEESGARGHRDSKYCWLIDPLDGTTNYAHRFAFFAVSIALLRHGEAVVGVVYDPLRKELFFALKRKGAYLNHKRIRVSSIGELKRSLVSTGFPYRFGNAMRRNINNFARVMQKVQAVRRPGSAALDLCYVAAGRFEGFWELDLHPWDTAAGALIVEEAGGKVTNLKGERFNPFMREIIASDKKIHSKLMEILV